MSVPVESHPALDAENVDASAEAVDPEFLSPESSPMETESVDDLAPASPLPQIPVCLNCGNPVSGHFCSHCGQENEDRNVALKLLAEDFLADLASWDSKLFRTMIPLLFRPGFLTNEYNSGRRARYLAPLRLYLTLSVLFFLVFSCCWRLITFFC